MNNNNNDDKTYSHMVLKRAVAFGSFLVFSVFLFCHIFKSSNLDASRLFSSSSLNIAIQGANYKKILRLSYDVIITYDNRKSNLR